MEDTAWYSRNRTDEKELLNTDQLHTVQMMGKIVVVRTKKTFRKGGSLLSMYTD